MAQPGRRRGISVFAGRHRYAARRRTQKIHSLAERDVLTLLAPFALVGLLALAVPIAIHILAKRRAVRVLFPTLRFILPGRLASVRRHVLDDAALLAVRLAILAAAVLALAGPLVVTRQRDAMWNARLQTAVVDGGDLSAGLRRATVTLDDAPPGRRQIVVRSTFPMGSITQADVAAVPAAIGLTFERTGGLPPTRTIDLPSVLTDAGVRARTMTVDRATVLREGPVEPSAAGPRDPTLSAVLSQHVLAPVSGRRMRIVYAGAPDFESAIAPASTVREPWMADGLAAIASDTDVRAASRQMGAALTDSRLLRSPWLVVAKTGDGRPLAVGASSSGVLTMVTAAPPSSLAAALLVRGGLNALGDARLPADAETVAISDAQLHAWTRPPGPAPAPRLDTLERDDRRWLWIAALVLLVVEWRIRRRSPEREARRSAEGAKAARVA